MQYFTFCINRSTVAPGLCKDWYSQVHQENRNFSCIYSLYNSITIKKEGHCASYLAGKCGAHRALHVCHWLRHSENCLYSTLY